MGAPGVTSIKTFTYRGAAEEWSNQYRFVGDAPSSEADWRSLVDDLVALEAPMLSDRVSIVRALCYEDIDDDSVYTYDLTHFAGAVPGALDHTDAGNQAGDDALTVRWSTGRRTSTGKPIYLRKYYHGVMSSTATDGDDVWSTMATAAGTFAAAVLASSGDWPGLADVDGDAPPGGYFVDPYVTTRTLKRRGRRPT